MSLVDNLHVQVAFTTAPDDPAPAWTDITPWVDLVAGISVTKGRADEFATPSAGTCRVTLNNSDGRFTAGRGPMVTRTNLVPNPSLEVDLTDWTANQVTLTRDGAWAASGAWSAKLVPTGADSYAAVGGDAGALRLGITPGRTYTFSATIHLAGAQTGSLSSRARRAVVFYNNGGYVEIAGPQAPNSAGDFRASLTLSIPAGATEAFLRLYNGSDTAADVVWWDAVLVEESATPGDYFDGATANGVDTNGWVTTHAWTGTAHASTSTETPQPPYYPNVKIRKKIRVWYQDGAGPISYRFTGYVEEWPCEWPGGSAYTVAQVSAVDRFKRLGAIAPLRSIIEQEYLSDLPFAYYLLGEPEASTTAGDTSGNGGSPMTTAQQGAGGTLAFGVNTGPGTDGLSAPAFTRVNATNGKYLQGPFAGLLFEQLFTAEAFFLTSSVSAPILTVQGPGTAVLWVDAAGKVAWVSAVGGSLTSPLAYNDGLTHHVAVTQSVAAGTLTTTLYVDGVSKASSAVAASNTDYGSLDAVGGDFTNVFNGTIAHVAIHKTALSAARILAHAQSGLTGFAGERSDQRIARLAGYAGIPSAEQSLEVGLSTSIAHVDTTGLAPLQAMQDVAFTEGGVLFVDGAGVLAFHARSHRYNTVSTLTLDAGSVDPSARFVPDDSLLVNDVTASRPGGITFRAVNAASVTEYGTSAQSVTLLVTTDNEVMDAANWKANQSSSVNPRLPNLTLDLLTLPSLAASILLLGLGSRITVSGWPSQAPAATLDLYVEGWSETVSLTSWALTLNTSAASDSSVWQLDSALNSILGTTTRLAY